MKDNTLNSIKKSLAQNLPKDGEAYLFGSRARGDARQDSDWDILIILNKAKLSVSDYDDITYPLVTLGWELNEEINPILYSRSQWEQSHITPFYHNVKEDAVRLL